MSMSMLWSEQTQSDTVLIRRPHTKIQTLYSKRKINLEFDIRSQSYR